MTLSRRHVLIAAAATVAAALSGRFTRPEAALALPLPPSMDPLEQGGAMLVLHDGGPAALAFARTVRAAAGGDRVSDCTAAMLTLAGFTEAGVRVDRMRSGVLLALLDEADTVVVEALLRARNAGGLTRRRYGRQVLLCARLHQRS